MKQSNWFLLIIILGLGLCQFASANGNVCVLVYPVFIIDTETFSVCYGVTPTDEQILVHVDLNAECVGTPVITRGADKTYTVECIDASSCVGTGSGVWTEYPSCDDSDVCTEDRCDPATGDCAYTPICEGCFQVCKAIDWNGWDPVPGLVFDIMVDHPGMIFLSRDIVDGECTKYEELMPGDYHIDEWYLPEWIISGAHDTTVTVLAGDTCEDHKYTVINTYNLGCLQICKNVDWNGVDEDPNQEFEICVDDGDTYHHCEMLGKEGDTCYTWDLLPGEYNVIESYPGEEWVVDPIQNPVTVSGSAQCIFAEVKNTYQTTDPTEAVDNVISAIKVLHLPKGIDSSLISKLENTIDALNREDTGAAINKLNAFIKEVQAQRCKKIPCDDADELIAMVQQIIDSVGG